MAEAAYKLETDPWSRAVKGLAVAKNALEVGRQHHQQQDPPAAIRHYQRAAELVEDALVFRKKRKSGKASSTRAVQFFLTEIWSSHGVACNDIGEKEEALLLLKRALDLRKEAIGKEHGSVAECLNNIGALHFARQNYQRSVEYYEQAFELLVGATGRQEGAYVALTLYNIGLCRAKLDNPRLAVTSLRKSLTLAQQALGPNHRQVELIEATIKEMKPGAPGRSEREAM